MPRDGGVYRCKRCGEGIFDGQEALIYGRFKLCNNCIEEMNGREILNFLDLPLRNVELEELLDV